MKKHLDIHRIQFRYSGYYGRSESGLYMGDVIQDAALIYDGGKLTTVYDSSAPYWSEDTGRFPAGDYLLSYDQDGRLEADGTRGVEEITYRPFGNLPARIKMENGDFTHSDYLPDGTLTRRQY